jgi:hypothetical protein
MSKDDKEESTLFQVDGAPGLAGKTFRFEQLITDPEVKVAVRAMVIEAITEGIRAHCRLPIANSEAQQLRYFMDGIKSLGNGDVHTGMEAMFDDIKAVQGFRARFSRVAEKVGTAVLISIALGMVGIFGLGAWFKFKP